MTLANIIRQKLAEAKPVSDRHELLFTGEGCPWTVHLTADRRDEWSTVVWEFSIRRGSEFGGDLTDWADRVVKGTVGVLDPIKVVEIDRERNEALLRTANPQLVDGKLLYHELVLHGASSALIRRFQAARETGSMRLQVPFALTNESLAKLAGDVALEK